MSKITVDIHLESDKYESIRYECEIIFWEGLIKRKIIKLYESSYNILLSKLTYELSIKENLND